MKRIIKTLAIITAGMLLLSACGAKLPDDVVASVNGANITKAYYDKTVAKVGEDNGFTQLYGEEIWDAEIDKEKGITFRQQFAKQMLDIIIMQELAYQDSEGKDIRATDEQVQIEFDAFKDFVKKDQAYADFIEKNGIDDEFVKEHLLKTLTYNNYIASITNSIEVADEEAKEFYNANLKDYTKDEVRASHILISTLDPDKQPLPEEEKAEKRKKAEEVLVKAKSGEDFAKLAEEYSDDPGSAISGGDLGYFGQGVMVPEFNDKAFSMKVGEISDLVETQYGYHIIYLTDKNDGELPFEKVKDDVKSRIKYNKYQDKMSDLKNSAQIIVNKSLEVK